MKGYANNILRVNLSSQTISTEPLGESVARTYLGGRGLGAKILFDEVPAGTDPLSADNKLVFAAGPLAGTFAPASGRYVIMAKSPMTGGFGEAYTGGFFAHELKFAGYDAIIIEGESEQPVYLHIRNKLVELLPADDLWGKPILETEKAIKEGFNDLDYKIAGIGPGGEKKVAFACILNDTDRAAGRTGLGAVMGAKRLKAIAVRGTGSVEVADPEAFREYALKNLKIITDNPVTGDIFPKYGTGEGLLGLSQMGILPTHYWGEGTFDYAEDISSQRMSETILAGHRACQACPVGCTRVVRVPKGKYGDIIPEYGGPEYETLAAFGSLCDNRDLEAIAMANQQCNAYGIDTISAGAMIAFAMECYEKGIISEEQIGKPLSWGDAQAIVDLVDKIGRREGIGDLLAMGVKEAAKQLGAEAQTIAVEVKGLDLPMHEARGKQGLGLSYATAPRGGNHMEGFHDPAFMAPDSAPEIGITKPLTRLTLEDKPDAVYRAENYNSFINSIPICSFMSLAVMGIHNCDELTGLLVAATGWKDFTFEEELAIGERAYTLAKAYTARETEGKPEEDLPEKMFDPLPRGGTKDNPVNRDDFKAARSEYYRLRGWDETGCPTKEGLRRLGLQEAAEALHGKGDT